MKKLSFPVVIVGLLVWWVSSFGEATAGPLPLPFPAFFPDQFLHSVLGLNSPMKY